MTSCLPTLIGTFPNQGTNIVTTRLSDLKTLGHPIILENFPMQMVANYYPLPLTILLKMMVSKITTG